MKRSSEVFIPNKNTEWEDLGEGVSRKILGWNEHIMMVKVKFEEGAIGSHHQHTHSQTTHIESGKFDFTVGENIHKVQTGDGLYIPPNETHGAKCIEAGVIIDVFSPVREDFLS